MTDGDPYRSKSHFQQLSGNVDMSKIHYFLGFGFIFRKIKASAASLPAAPKKEVTSIPTF